MSGPPEHKSAPGLQKLLQERLQTNHSLHTVCCLHSISVSKKKPKGTDTTAFLSESKGVMWLFQLFENLEKAKSNLDVDKKFQSTGGDKRARKPEHNLLS